jgi:N-acetylmuramoyl-L-alanine amidase
VIKMAKVGIGVGHGGKDPGAVANGFRESDINLVIALTLNDELIRHGVKTYMTRTKDEDDPLTDEIKEINAFNPDIAVDIHDNAGGGDGADFFYSKNTNGLGKRLAELMKSEVIALGQNIHYSGTKLNKSGQDYYGFIREIKCPSIIAEGAFIDNADDVKFIGTKEKQKDLGIAYAKAILNYLRIAWQPPVSSDNADQEVDYKALYEEERGKIDAIKKILE